MRRYKPAIVYIGPVPAALSRILVALKTAKQWRLVAYSPEDVRKTDLNAIDFMAEVSVDDAMGDTTWLELSASSINLVLAAAVKAAMKRDGLDPWEDD